MDKISSETVEKVAALAKLTFTEEEKTKMALELDEIVNFMEKIGSVNTENITSDDYCRLDDDKLRSDEPLCSLTPDEVFLNAPENRKNCIAFPKVI